MMRTAIFAAIAATTLSLGTGAFAGGQTTVVEPGTVASVQIQGAVYTVTRSRNTVTIATAGVSPVVLNAPNVPAAVRQLLTGGPAGTGATASATVQAILLGYFQ